jgi:spore germination protein KA/spore germination protein
LKKLNFKNTVALLKEKELDIKNRTIPYNNGQIELFYVSQLTDKQSLTENVIKPVILYCSLQKEKINAQVVIDNIIYAEECTIESDADKILNYVISGFTVMLFSSDSNYVVLNLKRVEQRNVSSPEISYSLRGPQDCFTENLDTNLSLIRYRVKDKNIRIKNYSVGIRSKTRVAVIYIEDIANNAIVTEIQKRIKKINVDGIAESGELQAHLLDNKYQYFPQMGLVERSDMALHSLFEGKVIILVEGSGIALIAPKLFSEFLYSCDDRYDNKFFGIFARMIRFLSLIIALTASSLFVALTSFHTDVLPTEYAISLAEMRSNVPFNALTGALILEFIVELLRESLLRVPKQIGSAIGIVGAIVIGQAAVSAGIFSPLLLIVVSTALLASFAIPDYTLINTIRILKFVLLLFTGAFGFYGFTIFLTFILSDLVSMSSFGIPYMAPLAPYNKYDFKNSLIKSSSMNKKRLKYLKTKNKIRSK